MSVVISLFIYRATSRLLLDKFLMQIEQCIDRQCDDVQCVASFSSIMCVSDHWFSNPEFNELVHTIPDDF